MKNVFYHSYRMLKRNAPYLFHYLSFTETGSFGVYRIWFINVHVQVIMICTQKKKINFCKGNQKIEIANGKLLGTIYMIRFRHVMLKKWKKNNVHPQYDKSDIHDRRVLVKFINLGTFFF